MRSIVFDIECDGLLKEVSKVWIAVAVDTDSGEWFEFSDYDPELPPLSEFFKLLENSRMLVGHNILLYDMLVLEKLFGWRPKRQKLVDTLVMSQVLNYKRFGFGHSLARWGTALGREKPKHEDWSKYSKEMRHRCREDVEINLAVYNKLLAELSRKKNQKAIKLGLKAEHGASQFVGRAQLHGWPFDIVGARKLMKTLEDRMEEIASYVEPKMGKKCKQVDRNPEFKSTAWVANGDYAKRTYEWFDLEPSEGQEGKRPVTDDYCRVEYIDIKVGSTDLVKEYLYRIGWVPDDWNFKMINGKLTKTTPKLSESSLEPLGEIGKMISEFYTIRARHSILRTWVETDYNGETGRIYGDSFVIGTPTGRSRHQIIANIPSADALYGPEIRRLFSTIPGYKVVGADSSSNQNRALCHYLKNEDYTRKVIEVDIHSANLEVLESILGPLGDGGRRKAKAFFYALIFGGGDAKLGLIISGKRDASLGRKVRDKFLKAIPGFDTLVARLKQMYKVTDKKTGKPHIYALDTRPIFVDSDHKSLNYLLQSAEKITCAAAVAMIQDRLDSEGFDWQPLIMYHDELAFLVREDQAERAAIIAREGFAEAPKWFGVDIMDGEAKIGLDWFEVH